MTIIQILYRLLPKNESEKRSFCTHLSLDYDLCRFAGKEGGFVRQARDYLYAHFNKANASATLNTLRYPVSYQPLSFSFKKTLNDGKPTYGSGKERLCWLDFNLHSLFIYAYATQGDVMELEYEYSRISSWQLEEKLIKRKNGGEEGKIR